jgi:hypothetical protein
MAGFNWPSTRQSLGGIIWIVGLAGLVAAWMSGVPRLQAHVASHRPAAAPEVRFVDPPAWMSGDLEAWLVLTVQQQITADPLDREALARARSALLQTGCFESVRQVRRNALDRIEVEAVFLQPFAAVVDRDGEHLVDPRGRLLPDGYQMGPASHFIRITGAAFDRPRHPGEQWIGSDVTAALHVIRMIVTRPWWRQVIAVDVSDVERVKLTSLRNCRIVWGAPPGEEAIGEVTAEQKLSRLDYLDQSFGRIDVDCPNELDITDPEVVTVR